MGEELTPRCPGWSTWFCVIGLIFAWGGRRTADAQSNFDLPGEAAFEELEVESGSPPAQESRSYVKVIRRLGVLPALHNLNSFRQDSFEMQMQLFGFAAQGWSGNEIGFRLHELLHQAVNIHGRFWTLDALLDPSQVQDLERRNSLSRKWDLDAWLQVKLFFQGPTLLVKLDLIDRGKSESALIASESVVGSSRSTEAEIVQLLTVGLQRLGNTLAHWGEITWHSESRVTLDIGNEVVRPGDEMLFGLISPSVRHPGTGEVLETDTLAAGRLKVLETYQGASLAEIIDTDPLRAEAIDLNESYTGLSVWKEPASGSVHVEKNNSEHLSQWSDVTVPKSKSTSMGYGESPVDSPKESKTEVVPEVESAREENTSMSDSESDLPEATEDLPQSDAGATHESSQGLHETAPLLKTSELLLHQPRVSGLIDFGILKTRLGDRYTGFPSTVLNRIRADFGGNVPGMMDTELSLDLSRHKGGDVEGVLFEMRANGLIPLSSNLPTGTPMEAYGRTETDIFGHLGLSLVSGTAEAVLRELPVGRFDVSIGASSLSWVQDVGQLKAQALMPLFKLMSGDFLPALELQLLSSPLFPPQLGVSLFYRRLDPDYQSIATGMSWSF